MIWGPSEYDVNKLGWVSAQVSDDANTCFRTVCQFVDVDEGWVGGLKTTEMR